MRNTFLNDYFGFNRQQRNGLWLLLLFSFLLFMVRLLYPYFISPAKIEVRSLPIFERRIDSAAARSGHYRAAGFDRSATGSLFVFDPNTASAEQLQQLGLRGKTAATLIKFRSRGFVFKEKKDLLKVYGISDKLFATLEPYILIKHENKPAAPAEQERSTQQAPAKAPARTELNSADSMALLALNGIGPAFAKRILKYRAVLGGYTSVEQLREVYGFTEELFEKVKPVVEADAALVKKIHLNTDDFKTVNRHPYLSYELTRLIFNARRQAALDEGRLKAVLNDDALYDKLLPYLAF